MELFGRINARGKKVINTAELERFYGKRKSPPGMGAAHNGNSQSDTMAQNGTNTSAHNGTVDTPPAVTDILADQVALLKSPLDRGRDREITPTPRCN